jgi:hypothetical protein
MNNIDNIEKDLASLKFQLNSEKINLNRVIRRCPHGYPLLILLNPVIYTDSDGIKKISYESLSNLIWLTCPFLNDKIHKLETGGSIRKISDFINSDRTMFTMMKDAHTKNYYLRKKMIEKVIVDFPEAVIDKHIVDSGIGGIRDIAYLKCLHLHYAHYLICDENIAGKIVSHLINGESSCKKVMCQDAYN